MSEEEKRRGTVPTPPPPAPPPLAVQNLTSTLAHYKQDFTHLKTFFIFFFFFFKLRCSCLFREREKKKKTNGSGSAACGLHFNGPCITLNTPPSAAHTDGDGHKHVQQ